MFQGTCFNHLFQGTFIGHLLNGTCFRVPVSVTCFLVPSFRIPFSVTCFMVPVSATSLGYLFQSPVSCYLFQSPVSGDLFETSGASPNSLSSDAGSGGDGGVGQTGGYNQRSRRRRRSSALHAAGTVRLLDEKEPVHCAAHLSIPRKCDDGMADERRHHAGRGGDGGGRPIRCSGSGSDEADPAGRGHVSGKPRRSQRGSLPDAPGESPAV